MRVPTVLSGLSTLTAINLDVLTHAFAGAKSWKNPEHREFDRLAVLLQGMRGYRNWVCKGDM